MKLSIIATRTTPLCYLPSGKLVCYKDGCLVVYDDDKVVAFYPVFHEKWYAKCKAIFRALRLGIRAAAALDEEHVVHSRGNVLYEYDFQKKELSQGYVLEGKIRPLIFTEIKGIDGFEDGIVFGGYLGNMDKNPVNIYRRAGKDQWEVVYTFAKGEINHVHNIVPDPYRNCLWVFTGDFGDAAAIWKVTENFKKVERVLYGDQRYRACVVNALPEGLLYATDSPLQEDFIYLLKPDMKLEQIRQIEGSCIYGCKCGDKYVFETSVEPPGIYKNRLHFFLCWKRGPGIMNQYAHIYVGNFETGFEEVYKEKKDWLPFVFQFGVFKFPFGQNKKEKLHFQPVATNKNDLKLISIDL